MKLFKYLTICWFLFFSVQLSAQPCSADNGFVPNAGIGCLTVCENDIMDGSAVFFNQDPDYFQWYFLTDPSGLIIDANEFGQFPPLLGAGQYFIYIMNLASFDPPVPPFNGPVNQGDYTMAVGTSVFDIGTVNQGCYNADFLQEFVCYDVLPAPQLEITTVDPSCGQNNGQITATVNSNPGIVYQYTLNGMTQTTGVFTGLAAGTYTIEASDGNGLCFALETVTLVDNGFMSLALNVLSDVSCAGAADGAVDLSIVGGTPPYLFDWDNDGTGDTDDPEDLMGLPAGTYSVVVIDANDCTATGTVAIVEPTPIDVSVSPTAACNGIGGAIDITVSGGVMPYSYAWNTGAMTEDISGLSPGNYSVAVVDANGCVANTFIELMEGCTNCQADNGSPINPTIGGCMPICESDILDGTFTGFNTDPNYFQWYFLTDPSGMIIDANDFGVFSPLFGAGQYYIYAMNVQAVDPPFPPFAGPLNPGDFMMAIGTMVTDIGQEVPGCYNEDLLQEVVCFDVFPIPQLEAVTIDPSCGEANGEIIVAEIANPGVAYLYTLNGMTQTSGTFTGLPAGTYTIEVTDPNGLCFAMTTATLSDTGFPTISLDAANDLSCAGAADGSIEVTVTGGTLPYTFDWDNDGTGDNDDMEDLTDLAAGTYSLVVTDMNGCTADLTVTLTEFTPINVDVLTFAPCNGVGGSIDITVFGGAPPYTYAWNTGAMTEDISDIPAGSYSVAVVDANGCVANTFISLMEDCSGCEADNGTPVNSPGVGVGCIPICQGDVIDATSVGFNTDPDYLQWYLMVELNTGIIIYANDVGLFPSINTGLYQTYSFNFDIFDPPSPMNAAPYTIPIQPFDFTSLIGTLVYDIGTPDVGCYDDIGFLEDITCFEVVSGPQLQTSTINPTCGDSNGEIIVTEVANPGVVYMYSLNGVTQNNGVFTGLPSGTYTVEVFDPASGCFAMTTVVLESSESPVLTLNSVGNTTCAPVPDGFIDVTLSGGTPPYIYDWDNDGLGDNDDSEDIGGLAPGVYTLMVTDVNGCSATLTATVLNGCCTPTLVLPGNILPITHQADVSVESDGTVLPGTMVEFKAGEIISLLPGFSVEQQAAFSAEIEECGVLPAGN